MLEDELELDGALEPLAAPPLLLGVEDEPLADGVLLEPLDALPEGELDDGVLAEPDALDEPPDAESFFVASDEAELEDDDGVLGWLALPDTEPDAEPDGELGVVVEPADDEDAAPPGWLVRETARSLSPQPVRSPAPSAMDTATAKAESLI